MNRFIRNRTFPFISPGLAVEVEGLSKTFDGRTVLDSIGIAVPRGCLTVLIGPSGCGKTTLLRCLNGLDVFDCGRVTIAGITVERPQLSGKRWEQTIRAVRRKVGIVFQSFNLFPHLTVLDNLTLAPRTVKGESREQAETRAMELLKLVGLADKVGAYPDFLSGGQQQRVAIARALAMEPEVILYDEPTSAIDEERVDEVLDVMEALDARDMTQVVVTHEIAFAREVAEHVVFLDEGAVVEEGPPEQVLTDPLHPRTRKFLRRFLATLHNPPPTTAP